LDEADRMLDMGFLPDVMKIVEQLPKERQTMLFSATMVDEVQKVVDQVMVDPEEVEFEVSKPADSVDQQIYFVHPKQKLSLFEELFDADKYKTAIVFCATKRGTDEVERMLKKRGVNAVSMHGDRDQDERNEALRLFKNKSHPVMVATDVLSRGIDIDDVSLIVNFDVPNNPEDYIHRIGRTGRYDKKGTAITFVSNKDKKYYHAIKNVVGDQLTVKELPDEDSSAKKDTKKKERRTREKKSQETKPKEESSKTKKPVSREESKFAKEAEKNEKEDKQSAKPKKESKPKKEKSKEKPKKKKERKPRPSRSKGKSKGRSEKKSSGSKKSSPKKNNSGRSGKNINIPKHIREADQEEDIFQPEIIEKAVARNRRSLKPAKGIWGVIKSYIPKIGF
jgi:superfamily II DNA/RNA helicase